MKSGRKLGKPAGCVNGFVPGACHSAMEHVCRTASGTRQSAHRIILSTWTTHHRAVGQRPGVAAIARGRFRILRMPHADGFPNPAMVGELAVAIVIRAVGEQVAARPRIALVETTRAPPTPDPCVTLCLQHAIFITGESFFFRHGKGGRSHADGAVQRSGGGMEHVVWHVLGEPLSIRAMTSLKPLRLTPELRTASPIG